VFLRKVAEDGSGVVSKQCEDTVELVLVAKEDCKVQARQINFFRLLLREARGQLTLVDDDKDAQEG
jgi:hypothetical protein